MARPSDLELIRRGVEFWNEERSDNPANTPDLSECDLADTDLSGANLYACKMTDTNLAHSKLIGANLRLAVLARACLDSADLSNADLSVADLRGASLSGAVLKDAKLDGANLQGADCTDVDFSGRHYDWPELDGGFPLRGYLENLRASDEALQHEATEAIGHWPFRKSSDINRVPDALNYLFGLVSDNSTPHRALVLKLAAWMSMTSEEYSRQHFGADTGAAFANQITAQFAGRAKEVCQYAENDDKGIRLAATHGIRLLDSETIANLVPKWLENESDVTVIVAIYSEAIAVGEVIGTRWPSLHLQHGSPCVRVACAANLACWNGSANPDSLNILARALLECDDDIALTVATRSFSKLKSDELEELVGQWTIALGNMDSEHEVVNEACFMLNALIPAQLTRPPVFELTSYLQVLLRGLAQNDMFWGTDTKGRRSYTLRSKGFPTTRDEIARLAESKTE